MPARRPSSAPRGAVLLALLALLLVACAGAATSPSPTTAPASRPTLTPIAPPVVTPADAAAVVIASDPRFEGTIPLTPDVIGASKWWTSTPLEGGGYRIEVTVGWGDCPAGCINRHVWTFEVTSVGALRLVGERGNEVPPQLPE